MQLSARSVSARNNVTLLGDQDARQTLVFATGFGTTQRIWHPVTDALMADYRIVLFDYVGGTDNTVSYFNTHRYNQLHSFADDILDILEELRITNAVLIGHSAGGMSGLLAAIQEPGWFSRLVLLNVSPRYVNETDYVGGFDQETLTSFFAQMESNFHAWASGFATLVMANPDRPHLARAFAQTLANMRPDVALAIANVIFYSDHRADITRLQQPTLLLQSRRDPAVPEFVSYYLQKHIPNATLNFIECEGHFPHVSDADSVIGAVRSFLADQPPN